jgi:dihydroorotase
MIYIKQAATIDGGTVDLEIPGEAQTIQANGLLALPAVIDPHVHFRTPGMEYKEDWRTGARAAIRGGCTTVFDMPNTKPPTITADLLKDKKTLINDQLQQAKIPLRYQLFFGADKAHLDEISRVKDEVIGIKVFMGCSTGNLVIDDDESLARVFELAAKYNLIVAVHAEDEHMINENRANYQGERDYPAHSKIRNIAVAEKAVAKAIALTRQFGTRLYVLHVSSAQEVELIRAAKAEGLPVFAETTPHHLFFNTDVYESLQGRAVVNPPLRDNTHQSILMQAIRDGVIDTLGSDHAPHTLEEKSKPYGECPSGMPGIEFVLPLLLTAWQQKKLSLENIVSLTSGRAKTIFNLPDQQDWVLVDTKETRKVKETASKCGWTPYEGMELTGWPKYTILRGQCHKI